LRRGTGVGHQTCKKRINRTTMTGAESTNQTKARGPEGGYLVTNAAN